MSWSKRGRSLKKWQKFNMRMCCGDSGVTMDWILEPVCCKKRQKIVPDQLLVWRIRASEGFEWYQTLMIMGTIWTYLESVLNLQFLQRSPTLQTSNWSRTIFCPFLQQTVSKSFCLTGPLHL